MNMTALKIANRWFERKRISDDITLLWEPHVHPLVRCNIWHVRGRDKDMLVDTGVGVASLKDEIQDLIDKPIVAVASHIHYDHVGCLHEFEERLVHSSEAEQMANYGEFSGLRAADLGQDVLQGLADAGYPIDDEFLIDALPNTEFSIDGFRIQSAKATKLLDEGMIVDIGDRCLEVLHLPGHSPGSLGLWEEASGTLFSGDAIYDGPLLDELAESSIPDYIETMKRLKALPVQVVHGGHDPSFGRDRMVEICDEYLAWRDQ
jgi:glyoxylase-like metal-dependent hydrolase (beta-lactamase superfamily II)